MGRARQARTRREADGFTLVEVLIAMMLVAVMAASTATLFAVAVDASRRARGETSATVLAIQKIEQLRALTWGVGPAGPVTDFTSDLSREPSGQGGAGLGSSPAGTLAANVAGYVDYLDEAGRWVGTGAVPPPRAVWTRRWSVRAMPSSVDTVIVQVRVIGAGRRPTDAYLVSVKTRKAE